MRYADPEGDWYDCDTPCPRCTSPDVVVHVPLHNPSPAPAVVTGFIRGVVLGDVPEA